MKERFTAEEHHEIAGRARTIHERLDGPSNDPGANPPIEPDEILENWRKQFPEEKAFQARLEQSGLTETRVRNQIAATQWPRDEPLPDWIDELERLVKYIETNRPTDLGAVPDDAAFPELLAVVAEYARGQLSQEVVLDDALSPMVEGLVSQLFLLCIRPLYVEFKSFVEHHDSELAYADPDDFEEPPTEYYDRFIDAMFEHGFKNFCLEYPVLARQLVYVTTHWVEAVEEVCQRIDVDQEVLQERFGVTGNVTKLEPLSDDAHAKGRLPVRVSFESDDVIYKPREVGGGFTLYTILRRLDEHLSTPSLKIPTYLLRDDYGWMQPVEYQNLPNEGAASRYYERAGAIACAAYALNLPDCQFENLIVDGEYPMIIDGETLFHPYINVNAQPHLPEISAVASQSVLLTLLFPWSVGDPRRAHEEDIGVSHAGFGSSSETRYGERMRPWVKAVNTDVMSVVEKQPEVDLSTNTPSFDGNDEPPRKHMESLVRGFSEAHETIRSLHADGRFFSDIAPPELIEGIENRLVYRATARYGEILRSTAARNPLQDGARLSVEFEQLAVQFFDENNDAERYWQLYEAERRALRRRDIPRFASRLNERTLYHDEDSLDVSADASGYELCRERVETMDDKDLARQTWLMQYSFNPGTTDVGTPPSAEVSEERFESVAKALFDDVLDAGFETAKGDRWVSISPTNTGLDIYPTDPSLYHGRGGIALTAAALYNVTGEDRYRERVSTVLEPVVENIERDRFVANLGGMLGIGSVIYTLSIVAELLDDHTYSTTAAKAVELVTDEHIEKDQTFDILEGTAGTVLGLLAYYDRYGGEDALNRAISCGDRLLEGRTNVGGHRVWKTAEDKPPLTGFSHGASGIAYALAKLSARTGESRFAEAAREALDFEAELYDSSQTNWAKSHDDHDYVDKWCHGRSGIALARIGISEEIGDEKLLADANEALAQTASVEPSNMDHLCCGNLGRAEVLLVGSRRGSANRADAIELASRSLTRREHNGALSMTGHSDSFHNPMFFHGLSGVAYTLLRLQNPDLLPSVLLLE
ncbi:type 2 lanthipeptide synthetase LanM family protein [Haladaptatus cibarius]|uniref:type 2 lanthipeptide synthetase LanM family protein n=1 Tax=Haladaptatus cibarius TaxID=453847 RepID=UPI000678E5DC|nr:type 2 lanthipeptide synthetase LanM family protein [Haladaptatus cibarius]